MGPPVSDSAYHFSFPISYAEKCYSLSHVQLFVTPWTVAYQVPVCLWDSLWWLAMSFSGWSSRPRDQTWVSCTAGRFVTIWATRVSGSHYLVAFQRVNETLNKSLQDAEAWQALATVWAVKKLLREAQPPSRSSFLRQIEQAKNPWTGLKSFSLLGSRRVNIHLLSKKPEVCNCPL